MSRAVGSNGRRASLCLRVAPNVSIVAKIQVASRILVATESRISQMSRTYHPVCRINADIGAWQNPPRYRASKLTHKRGVEI